MSTHTSKELIQNELIEWLTMEMNTLMDDKMDKSDSYFSGYVHAMQDVLRLFSLYKTQNEVIL